MTANDKWNLPLTGKAYNLTAYDLAYLIFETEAVYGIRLPGECFKSYGLCTIDGIANAVCGCVND